MPNSAKIEQRAFFILLIILIILGLYIVSPFLQVIVLSLVLAILFYPLHKKYLKWTHERRTLSSILSVLSSILFLLIPIGIFFTLITTQLAEFVSSQGSALQEASVSGVVETIRSFITQITSKIEAAIGYEMRLSQYFERELKNLAATLAKYSPRVLIGTASFLLHAFIMIITLFYLFKEGAFFFNLIVRIIPIKDQYERRLAGEIKSTIHGVLYGSFLTGLIQAALATLGYYLAGLPAYFVWGGVTFFTSFLPMLGTGAVIIPASLVLMLQGKLTGALFLMAYGAIIIASADNVLRPYLIHSDMHQLILFLSIFGGLAIFGPIGLLLGPIFMAMLTATMRIYARDFAHIPQKKTKE